MEIAIANDHAAILLKHDILKYLNEKKNVTAKDFGALENQCCLDYPEYAWEVCCKVLSGKFDKGILICGTGSGMCIASNKVRGIRAVVCSDPYTARFARAHNDANILCIGSRVVGCELAKFIVDTFVETSFEGGRHSSRVAKIMDIESKN